MGFCMVRHLVTHARLEDKLAAILQFCVQLTLEAKQDVPLAAPMVCQVASRVFDHANPDIAKMLCAPVSYPTFSLVLGSINAGPIGGTKRNAGYVHDISLGLNFHQSGWWCCFLTVPCEQLLQIPPPTNLTTFIKFSIPN